MQVIPPSHRRRLADRCGAPGLVVSVAAHSNTTIDSISPPLNPKRDVGKLVVSLASHGNYCQIQTIASDGRSATLDTAADFTGTATVFIVPTFGGSDLSLQLFQAFDSNPDPQPSDFTECTFDGYAIQFPQDYIAPFTDSNGDVQVFLGSEGYVLDADPVTPNTVLGYWLTELDGLDAHVVTCFEVFASPIRMQAAGNGFTLRIPYQLPEPGTAVIIGAH